MAVFAFSVAAAALDIDAPTDLEPSGFGAVSGAFEMKQFVWISYDLGIKGDYEGLYAWLDARGARECGDSVACFSYEHPGGDVLEDMKEDLKRNVKLDIKKNRIYVIRLVDGALRGTFIFGRRRNAPWVGAAETGELVEDTNE